MDYLKKKKKSPFEFGIFLIKLDFDMDGYLYQHVITYLKKKIFEIYFIHSFIPMNLPSKRQTKFWLECRNKKQFFT